MTAHDLAASRFSFGDLAQCASREVKWRRRVYPNRVLTGRMSQGEANHEIRMMQAIAEHFTELAKTERLL